MMDEKGVGVDRVKRRSARCKVEAAVEGKPAVGDGESGGCWSDDQGKRVKASKHGRQT